MDPGSDSPGDGPRRRVPYNPLPGRVERPDDEEPERLPGPPRALRWWLAGGALLVVAVVGGLVWRGGEKPQEAAPPTPSGTARLTWRTTDSTREPLQPPPTRTVWSTRMLTPSQKPSARSPAPRPTVTVTSRVRVTFTAKPARSRTPAVGGGPDEPPTVRRSPPRTTAPGRPTATCDTWSECHDDPPRH